LDSLRASAADFEVEIKFRERTNRLPVWAGGRGALALRDAASGNTGGRRGNFLTVIGPDVDSCREVVLLAIRAAETVPANSAAAIRKIRKAFSYEGPVLEAPGISSGIGGGAPTGRQVATAGPAGCDEADSDSDSDASEAEDDFGDAALCGPADIPDQTAETLALPGSASAAAEQAGAALFSLTAGPQGLPPAQSSQAPLAPAVTLEAPMPLSPPAAPPMPWPARLLPTPTGRWQRLPGQAPPPLPPIGTEEHHLWQMRRDFVDGLRGDVINLAAAGPEGDRLARRAQVAMDIWKQHPESFAGDSPEAEAFLTRLPTLRVAICITCLKRDDQLKQTLPILCLLIARIRSERSSAHPKHLHRQPASK